MDLRFVVHVVRVGDGLRLSIMVVTFTAATDGIKTQSYAYRVPSLPPVLASDFDQTQQTGPEVSVPIAVTVSDTRLLASLLDLLSEQMIVSLFQLGEIRGVG